MHALHRDVCLLAPHGMGKTDTERELFGRVACAAHSITPLFRSEYIERTWPWQFFGDQAFGLFHIFPGRDKSPSQCGGS